MIEPSAQPPILYDVADDGTVRSAVRRDTGERYTGAVAAALWKRQRAVDAVALVAWRVISAELPDAPERRLDVGGSVVFGLPGELAADHGEAIAQALNAVCPDAIAESRLAVVWADG